VEGESEYLETDVRKKLLEHMKHLNIETEPVEPGTIDIEKKPYYGYHFSSSLGMVDNVGCFKVRGKNFDYIHIIRRG
jgi:hypothetical protein